MDFLSCTHFINGICGMFAVISGLYLFKYYRFQSLPKNLRRFLWYLCFPVGILVSFLSTVISIFAIVTGAKVATAPIVPQPLLFGCLRILIIITSQQLRLSYCAIILERLIATICLEKYSKYPASKLFSYYILLSILAQFPITIPAFFWIFFDVPSFGYEAIVWTSFVMHSLTLISCKFLYDKNQQMYKKLAYQCSLQQRHQIVENIKALKTLWPFIFVFSVIAPIGPILTIIFGFITKANLPIGLFYTTYNCTTIILAWYYVFLSYRKNIKNRVSSVEKLQITVLSPLGRTLPTHVSMDNYFHQLQNQWT